MQGIPCSIEISFSGTGFLCLGRALHQHLQINFIILFQIIYTLYREFGQHVDWYTYFILVLSRQSDFSVYSCSNWKLQRLCLSSVWVQPLAQWGSSLGLVLLGTTVMQINNCQWNPGLVPLDTYIILGVLICLLTLSASLRLGSMPCYRGNVRTVKAVMPNHFPKRLPLWVVKCIFLFYFHSIIFSISRERFFFSPLSSTVQFPYCLV